MPRPGWSCVGEEGFRWIPAFAGMTEERHSAQGNIELMHSQTGTLSAR